MTETLHTEPILPVEEAQARVLEWADSYSGEDAEAARILAENTVRLLGWSSLNEVQIDDGMPHPSVTTRQFKTEAAQPQMQLTSVSRPERYVTSSGHVFEDMQANSLRAADDVVAKAEELHANYYSQREEIPTPISKRRTSGAPQSIAAQTTPQPAYNRVGEQSLPPEVVAGSHSNRMSIIGDYERAEQEQQAWNKLSADQQYPGARNPELVKAWQNTEKAYDQAAAIDPNGKEALDLSTVLDELELQMREPFTPDVNISVDNTDARLEANQQPEVKNGAVEAPMPNQDAVNIETPASESPVAATNPTPVTNQPAPEVAVQAPAAVVPAAAGSEG